MDDWTQTLGAGPLLAIAAGAVALILILIMRFKVHAFLTLILVSLLTALATQIPVEVIVDSLVDGFGGTLGSVALLIALGAMLGKLVEYSGGAKVLAEKMVDMFGEKRAPFGLGLASLAFGFPIFFDAGLVVMLPVIFAVARRLGNNVLLYGIPAATAFSVMHVFAPPHPGPVAASELYGANLGLVLLVAIILAFPVWYLAGYLWGTFIGRRTVLPVPPLFTSAEDEDLPVTPPSVGTVIAILLLPLMLIFLNTGLDFLTTGGFVDGEQTWVHVLSLLGSVPIALLISVLVALVVLGRLRGADGTTLEKIVDSSLGPVASVILITGAGGMFGEILRLSGIGDALADLLSGIGVPIILAVWLIAVILRVAQGSATVALVTAAGLMVPAVMAGDFSQMQVVAITLATASGSVFASHVNDSGFWLVGRLMGMDVKTTLKVWTTQQALQSIVGFVFSLLLFVVF
ncbi:gluconate transporter [Brachybacterium faecium DSM 4810]|uniref:Gluconate transporter n=1 Tax=Brachybacterium faecium (strain ATCC 43885 / DSM 4810 / JCM 11609 / LMG 19847 / NBRC 14762 / NCIMB 9860 / 6-10) TaxID=446465 RepID=C7MH09_BRAFD|nr:GntP family permease [Brachybacterium faecium]ACU86457.1 gluconate transporter [Brachybacterium faecium DSM 4810]HJG51415.1 GntP family permease [Brachybacterium faecium]